MPIEGEDPWLSSTPLPPCAVPAAWMAGFSHLFHRLVDRFVQWNNARITRNALSQLSAHELNDIGLTPGDIDALTRR